MRLETHSMKLVDIVKVHTNSTWENSFIVNTGLDPGHQVFNISRRRHLGWPFEILVVLPEIFEPVAY